MSSLPAVNRVQTIRDLLAKSKGQIAAALPRHLTPDRMLRIAMTSIQSNYRLMECDPKSLVAAVMEASQLGLEPDGVLGRAYLIPYKVKGQYKAQLQIGYRGFLDLARRSGQVINAVVRLKDGGYDFEWMWRREIDAIRRSSKAAGDGPWVTHYEEMAKKTVIRRLAKRLPLSIEFQRAAVADEYAEAGVFTEDVVDMTTGEVVDVQAKTKMKLEALKEKMKQDNVSELPEPQEVPSIRDEFINLRSAGFATWVWQNRDRLSQASPEIIEEAR